MPTKKKSEDAILLEAANINPFLVRKEEKDKLEEALKVLKKDLDGCVNPKDAISCKLSQNEKEQMPKVVKALEDAIYGEKPETIEFQATLKALKNYAKHNESAAEGVTRGNIIAGVEGKGR